MRKLVILMMLVFLTTAHALANCFDTEGKLRVGDPATPAEKCSGTLALVKWEEALKICPAGTHLPTIRELAGFAKSRGAVGIIEIEECEKLPAPISEYSPPYYYKATSRSRAIDEFCYDHTGFSQPSVAGEVDDHGNFPSYWSSTTWWMSDWILSLREATGEITEHLHIYLSPEGLDLTPPGRVWCFKN